MNEQDRFYRLLKEIGNLQWTAALPSKPDDRGQEGAAEAYALRSNRCVLERDWVDAIERGLPYVERAIEEQRRYLHLEREVVRIDRAKRVSPESVRYLAQHSNHITHKSDRGDIVPDKLLVVEREETYAIYENRFLFTLVTALRAFVDKRLQDIEAVNEALSFVASVRRRAEREEWSVDAQLEYQERIKPPCPKEPGEQEETKETLNRLRTRIGTLFSSPMISSLRGTPPVSSPIVHTNVIKKSVNFRQALVLFEFLEGYQQPGYMVLTDTRGLCPSERGSGQNDLDALITLQGFALHLRSDPALLSELEGRWKEENERAEQERALQEQEREERILARIQEARDAEAEAGRLEAARLEGEVEKRELLLEQSAKRLGTLRDSVKRYSTTVIARSRASERQAKEMQESLEQETRRLKSELDICSRRLEAEANEHALTKERDKKLLIQQRESFEQELKKKDAYWKRMVEREREAGERALKEAERARK